MANKEASVFVINVNPSMRAKVIAGRKGEQVVVLLVGTRGTHNIANFEDPDQYKYITQVGFDEDQAVHMKMPDVDLLRCIASGTERGEGIGDVIDGIIVGIHILGLHCKHLKYAKKLYLLTDAENPMQMEEFDGVIQMAKDMGVEFTLIAYDFERLNDNEEHASRTKAQTENEAALRNVIKLVGGRFWHYDDAAFALHHLRTKIIKPVGFRFDLVIGDAVLHPSTSLTIPIRLYTKATEAKVPSSKRWSTLAEGIAESERNPDTFGGVELVRSYRRIAGAGDEDEGEPLADADGEEDLNREDLSKAFSYGKALVPCPPEDEAAMTLKTKKNIWVLGFVDKRLIKRESLMSGTWVVGPEPDDPKATYELSTIIGTCEIKQLALLVRFIRKDDAQPKLCVIVHSSEGWGLMAQLPFIGDHRLHDFTALTKLVGPWPAKGSTSMDIDSMGSAGIRSTQGEVQTGEGRSKKPRLDARVVGHEEAIVAMDKFIDSMDLMGAIVDAEGNPAEAFQTKDIFNPAIQRFYQCVAHRAIYPDDPNMPPMNPQIRALIDPLPDLVEKVRDAAKGLKNAFKVEKNTRNLTPSLLLAQPKKSKRRWAASGAAEIDADEILQGGGAVIDAADVMAAVTDTKRIDQIGEVDPIADFESMVKPGGVDMVTEAVKQMLAMVTKLVTDSLATEKYDKALACLVAVRAAAAREDESPLFNSGLRDLKALLVVSRHKPFWDRVVDQRISLLSVDDSPDSE
ncbi:SPOC like C-terminal domain-containing protein, partial [Blyttiomyces helicus]